MTDRKIEISAKANGTGTVHVDGHDLSTSLRGFRLTGEAGQMPILELDLIVYDHAAVGAEAEVTIPATTRETLITLGWRPPI